MPTQGMLLPSRGTLLSHKDVHVADTSTTLECFRVEYALRSLYSEVSGLGLYHTFTQEHASGGARGCLTRTAAPFGTGT